MERPTYASEEGQLRDDSQDVRIGELERIMRDHDKRFDTLQSPLWKRILFRLDGWPGQTNLNGKQAWRPWHRWWMS